ncbi:trypsin-like peptidase domain-containing protein [Heyndrickxia sporothermodurans]|nr:trypsin-like peptidase domain-containing protein [Heyndrickxia sporothermodurans]MEB6551082.1 trypsin-like peptidase domain-containing protein [Heyndrickxia sporothermodurans]MED3654286.1 trypsin-like peptidase domain-containing protein [Heyndrickxia sporothermodurans]MED3781856.1 trypsin-like peptidase domain-containing protein [Heyndrickxia sporothermodurans]PTY77554.1 serine protease [Heyndrickxia sporothermodurans]PTY81201.1 serine protease [Heyndrickxia sporothermodurans]
MGYYDDNDNDRYQRPKRSKGGSFISGLVGVIIGALLVMIAFPSLGNVFNRSSDQQTSVENAQNSQNNITGKSVSLDVTTDVTKAVQKAEKAVVGIANIQSQGFWSQQGQGKSEHETGSGSGVIYKKANGKAFIVTNNHVVEGADQLEVTLYDGKKLSARLLGSDVWTDLAVVEVDGKDVTTVAQFGDSDKLKLGEPVIAIGNPLGENFAGSVTQGIVSGVNRTVPMDLNNDGLEDWEAEVLQTDAAINPGNSGGALINVSGQVVGINSMKIAQEAVEGIGFSIPIKSAEPVINDLEKYGKIRRPAMGVTLQNVSDVPAYHQQETLRLPKGVTQGIMIESVSPGSPAAKAGMQEMDVIFELDGHKVNNILELRKYLYTNKKPGDSMKVKFYRQGKEKEATLKLTNESRL